MSDRLPAHDAEAERILLATVASDPGCLPEIASILAPENLYVPQHVEIMRACCALDAAGTYVEPASIVAWLVDSARIQHAGGAEAVGALLDRTATTQSPEQYARRLALLSAVRGVDAQCYRLHAEARAPMADPESWLAEAPELVRVAADSAARAATSTVRGIRDVAASLVTSLTEGSRVDGAEERIGTGIESLDEQIGMLARKAVHIVAARPGVGKTALAHQMVIRAAQRGVRCEYISLEMASEDLLSRSVAQIAGVDHRLIELRRIGEQHQYWEHVTRAGDQVSKLPIVYDDATDQSVASIRGSVKRAEKMLGAPVDLVVIDYVQLVQVNRRNGANDAKLLGEVSHDLRKMAANFDVAMVLVSQLNRPQKGTKPAPPRLEDIRESGDLEQDARVVIGVYRPDFKAAYGTAELHVLKCRQGGSVGVVETAWSGPTMSFADTERGEQPTEPFRSGSRTSYGDPPPRPYNEPAEPDYGIDDGF